MAKVFVSHASDDRVLAGELHGWLVQAGHQVFLDQDLRDGLAVGEEWEQRLHERLRWADAVVCVLTSAYVASQWCTAEVAIARSRGSWLLPVRAEPAVSHGLLSSVQHTDLTQDPAAARDALVQTLRRVDPTGGAGWPDDRSPFPGLRPFDLDWHRVFFGRQDDVEHLAELLRSPAERARGAALLVVGPSGCGKSSLVRAGLVPTMATEPGWWTLPPITPGANPVAALARELAAEAHRLGLDWTLVHVGDRLREAGLTGLANDLLLAAPGGARRHLLVVVDQAEELLTPGTADSRAEFARLVGPALSGPVRLVATLRSEFLDQLQAEALYGVATYTYSLAPLGREALRVVIDGPARLTGTTLDEQLVAQLVDDTGSGEALPLLAFTLAQLANGIGHGAHLSRRRYDQLGKVKGAITQQAEAALADALAANGRRRDHVIAALLRLVTVDDHGRPTRWRARRDELPAAVAADLDHFVTRRLLSTDTDNGSVIIEVGHEALLSAWPPLAQAITDNATALRARRRIEPAATEWETHHRAPTRLWTGGQLAAAVADTGARIHITSHPSATDPPHPVDPPYPEPTQRRPIPRLRRHRALVTSRVDLSPTAREFLRTSIRRDRRRRSSAITVLSVLLTLVVTAAGVAVFQQHNAQNQQRLAIAQQLVAQADATRDSDPRTALQLGLAAQHIHPTTDTRASLVNTLTATPYAGTLTGHTGGVFSMASSADGRTLATVDGDDGSVILWDLSDRAHPHRHGQPLTDNTGGVTSVAFSRDGRTLATVGFDDRVILWDLSDRAHPHRLGAPLTGNTGGVDSVAFTRDGRTLTTGGDDGQVVLWDLTGLNSLREHATERACTLVGQGLDHEQWARFIPSLEYEDTCPS